MTPDPKRWTLDAASPGFFLGTTAYRIGKDAPVEETRCVHEPIRR